MSKKIVLFLLLAVILCGCTLRMYKIYGVHELTHFDQKLYDNFLSQKVDTSQLPLTAIISTFEDFMKVVDLGIDSVQKKDFNQPIQIFYFKDNKIISHHVNCYAEPDKRTWKLNWNFENRFDFFPPKTAVACSVYTQTLPDFLGIYPINNKKDKPYTVLIFWTLMMENVSQDAIRIVIDNAKRFNQQDSLNIYLINDDPFMIDYYK
jgi:hypothetical protein